MEAGITIMGVDDCNDKNSYQDTIQGGIDKYVPMHMAREHVKEILDNNKISYFKVTCTKGGTTSNK